MGEPTGGSSCAPISTAEPWGMLLPQKSRGPGAGVRIRRVLMSRPTSRMGEADCSLYSVMVVMLAGQIVPAVPGEVKSGSTL